MGILPMKHGLEARATLPYAGGGLESHCPFKGLPVVRVQLVGSWREFTTYGRVYAPKALSSRL